MVNIKCLNPISPYGMDLLTENYQVVEELENAQAVLVRSASMHDMSLPEGLSCVARAGAGVNNIPLDARNHGYTVLDIQQDGPTIRYLIQK